MELRDVLRSTPSTRLFSSRHVDDQLLYDILDDARFAPSGGNRQAWRVVVLKDPARRAALAAEYLAAWHEYVAHGLAGLVAFSPTATDEDRRAAASKQRDAEALSRPDGFAETLADVPVLLAVVAKLSALAASDRDLSRYSLVGGASVYPFVWSILLSARDRGLGGVMTTVATRREEQLKGVVGLDEDAALAAVVALGYPTRTVTSLRRRPVEQFTTIDHLGGDAFDLVDRSATTPWRENSSDVHSTARSTPREDFPTLQ